MKTIGSKKQTRRQTTTNFEVKVENRQVEGLITYSANLQIFKLNLNFGTDKKYGEFILIFNQFIVNGLLMSFYNICVFM